MPSRRGRPHQGAELVEKLEECSDEARQRLKVIVQTLAGEITVEEACEILNISRSAFNKLRTGFIASAVHLLEPKKPGRKKREVSAELIENGKLRAENERLKFQLKAQQLREEIGILMPHLLRRPVKKTTKNR